MSNAPWRWLMSALLLVVLSGCATGSNPAFDTMRLVIAGGPKVTADAKAVAESPYARLQMEGAGLRAVMVLGNDDAGLQSWYGDSRHLLFLRNGLLVGSAGLAANADDIRIEGDNPFEHLPAVGEQPVAVTRRYDWRDGYRYGVQVDSELSRRGSETVEILGIPRELVRYEETLRGPGVRAKNEYWADQDGFIWKSRQLLAPGTMVEMVVLKPYRPGAQ